MKKANYFVILAVLFYLGTFPIFGDIERKVFIEIPKGSSVTLVSYLLSEKGVIYFPKLFTLYIKLTGAEQNIRAGLFEIPKHASYLKIARILQEQEGSALPNTITIPEGFTTTEIAEVLAKHHIIDHSEEFLNYLAQHGKNDLKTKFKFLDQIPTQNLEGYLFPDSYVFSKHSSYSTVLSAFLETFERKALPIYQNSELSERFSLHQVITLASIVEKEAYKTSEMPLISGVFHNRLKNRMALGSCPTVAFSMNQPRKKFISYEDLKYPSPYNTYLHKGLPPGPISAPGALAIQAAVSPQKTNYMYFVASEDGSHNFSKTLSEHLNHQSKQSRQ